MSTGIAAMPERTQTPDDAPRTEEIRDTLRIAGIATRPGEIRLPYVYYRRPGIHRPTLFFLGGGPGVSNLKFVPRTEWLEDFNVVVLEYRGVGKSSIELYSPHFAKGLKKLEGTLSLRDAAPLQEAYRAGFANLRKQGVAFEDFSVGALAEDLERLRRKLQLDQVYLVGHSFGTRIALHYQTRYRERVAGSVLFAMNTPGGFIWNPQQTRSVYQRYRDYLQGFDPKRAEALGRLLELPSSRPHQFGVLPVNDAKALFVAFFLSFNSWTRNQSLDALAAAQGGSAARWFLLDQSYDWFIRFGFNWADFFLKAYTADCDPEAVRHADAQSRDAIFQSPSSVLFAGIEAFKAEGGRCSADTFEPDYRNTLAINGEFDTTTPIERKPAGLPDERFIVVKGAGHADIFYPDHGAASVWLRRFLLDPAQSRPPQQLTDVAGVPVRQGPATPQALNPLAVRAVTDLSQPLEME